MSNKKNQNQENIEKEEMKKDDSKIEIERSDNQESAETNEEANKESEASTDSKIEELQIEISNLKDQLLRKIAEFENYKRRTDVDQANFVKYAGEAVISKLLPVYDDLRRSIEHSNSENSDSLKKGIELVYEKFTRTLKELGVEKIEAKGKDFDFNLHEALMQKEVEGVPPHTVVDEIEPGYMYKDKVIRHAKVIVSQESSSNEEK
ncbi:MAG: nucleotide exchange factor GrpE [Melioribacteraceae bacterium]|nr:nucleotide exchange factor GrpE [Melioribacteraceae bacterium]